MHKSNKKESKISKGKIRPSIARKSMKNGKFNSFLCFFFRFDGLLTFYWRSQTGFQVGTGTGREYTAKLNVFRGFERLKKGRVKNRQ